MLKNVLRALGIVGLAAVGVVVWYAAYPSNLWVLESDGPLPEQTSAVLLGQLRARVAKTCRVGCSVKRDARGRFEVRLPKLWVSPWTEGLLTTPAHFSMRFVVPVQDAEADSTAGVLLQGDSQSPYYRAVSDALVANEDIDDVWVSQKEDDGYRMTATLGPRGASALSHATADQAGKLLGLIMDGRVVTAPRLTGQIGGNIEWKCIRGNQTPEQHLRELGLLAHLMRAQPMALGLRIIRRP